MNDYLDKYKSSINTQIRELPINFTFDELKSKLTAKVKLIEIKAAWDKKALTAQS